jgi:transposase
MWLAGGNSPDFRTFAGFRSGRLKQVIDRVFGATVGVLVDAGYIKLKNYFLDGTKIEADANKYSFVVPRPRHLPPFAVSPSTPRQKAMPGVATRLAT